MARTYQDRLRRVRNRLDTATQQLDDALNADLEEYGYQIQQRVRRDVLGILSEAYDGDKDAILFAVREYFLSYQTNASQDAL